MVSFRTAATTGIGAFALIAAGLSAGAVHSTATAAPGDSTACPAAYPATELQLGQEVTGLTTAGSYRRGGVEHDSRTVPEGFTGFYRGSVADPSGDLLVFELEGSRITKADGSLDAGIWAGMSGSPLYAADGRLIGAVSYSFSSGFGSTFAGVTAADDLYALLDDGAAPGRARVGLSKAEQSQLRRQGVPAAATARGLQRLPVPTTLSGMQGARRATIEKIARRFDRAPVGQIGGATAPRLQSVAITPGSNFAAADSFGTISAYGVGTTTAVCGDQAIAFGHPAAWNPTTRSVHGASTTIIQQDGAQSFKMANLAAPSGTLVSDRLAGIVGVLGPIPQTALVQSTTTGPKPRSSETRVPNQDALGFIVANQVYLDNLLTLDQEAAGSATMTWKIAFKRANGSTQVFTRSNTYADSFSIGEAVVADVASDVDTIVNNPFEAVKVTKVTITQDATADYRALRVGHVEMRRNGTWQLLRRGSTSVLRPGSRLHLRVHLLPTERQSKAARTTRVFSLTVPKNAGPTATVRFIGNAAGEDDFWEESDDSGPTARSLPGLLAEMRQQARQNTVTMLLRHQVRGAAPKWDTQTITHDAPAVTSGYFTANLRQASPRR